MKRLPGDWLWMECWESGGGEEDDEEKSSSRSGNWKFISDAESVAMIQMTKLLTDLAEEKYLPNYTFTEDRTLKPDSWKRMSRLRTPD